MISTRRSWLAPARLTWLLLAGLIAVFAGERIVPHVGVARWILTGGGSILVLAATVLRYLAWRQATGDARVLGRLFFLTTLGCALAVLGFLLAGGVGKALGLGGEDESRRVSTALLVLSAILLAVSLLPLLAAHWAAGVDGQGAREAGAIDRLRATRVAAAGATVALAGAFLMLVGYVTSARDATIDLGYFKTASPGTAVTRITTSLPGQLRVLLFFPPANEVGDQVRGYFRALAAATRNVRIEEHDRLASPKLAEQYGVSEDGTMVLLNRDLQERYTVPTTIAEARPRLRTLDGDIERVLMRIARQKRTVYLTVGHGELNDPKSRDPLAQMPYGGIEALKSLFGILNYQVSDLGVHNGLGQAVPADAAMVVVLGPHRPFLDGELQALDRYLANGGAALIALEPGSPFKLGRLEQRLGVAFQDVPLADDQVHLQQRGNISDRQLIVTDRFSSHAALATLGQASAGSGMAMLGAGYLNVDLPGSRAAVLVRSLQSTFADRNRDFEPNEPTEKRDSYALVAAVEGDTAHSASVAADSTHGAKPDSTRDTKADSASVAADSARGATSPADSAAAGTGEPRRAMRAMVFADADLFSDAVVTSLGLNAALAADAVRWLGHEEQLSGETHSEEDVPIVHTRAEDVGWFYATIFGVPAIVLLAGLFGVRRRRQASVPGREA